MEAAEIHKRIGELKVASVEIIDDEGADLPLADAFLEDGLQATKIAFGTSGAADVIQKIVRERPEMLVGVSTGLRVDGEGRYLLTLETLQGIPLLVGGRNGRA
jgi:2-keto-3-deoxy-6-phosphogluconate aldolase